MHSNAQTPGAVPLADLDELLADSIGSAAEQVLDLDALLAESVTSVMESKAAKKAKERLAKGGLTPQELAEDKARLAAWEMRHVWKPEANVARFVEQECTRCGDFQYFFQGLFQRQSHRHFPTQQRRWVAVPAQVADLPNEVMTEAKQVPFCGECLEQVGFSWDRGYTEDGTPFAPQEPKDEIAEAFASLEPEPDHAWIAADHKLIQGADDAQA